jgi:hypothetical protein
MTCHRKFVARTHTGDARAIIANKTCHLKMKSITHTLIYADIR